MSTSPIYIVADGARDVKMEDASEGKDPDLGKFVIIPFLHRAGIGPTDNPRMFFRRSSFVKYVSFIDERVKSGFIGLIDGLPGTGKSSLLWYTLLCTVKSSGKSLAWFHFNRYGHLVNYVLVKTSGVKDIDPDSLEETVDQLIIACQADIMALDGVSLKNYDNLLLKLRKWRKKGNGRTGFITTSNKIERLNPDELANERERGLHSYFTEYSWELDEFLQAFKNDDKRPSPLFIENKAMFVSDFGDLIWPFDIEEIISQKYFVTGGSARWMLRLDRGEAEKEIMKSINGSGVLSNILNFELGPKQAEAKTHLYFSMEVPVHTKYGPPTTRDAYSIVSERATQILVEMGGANAIKSLYSHARLVNNPAFVGWILEADYCSRCKSNKLELRKKGDENATRVPCPSPPREFDCNEIEKLSAMDDKRQFKERMQTLLPSDDTVPVVCKPKAWNQGGYDVVRILKHEDTPIQGTSKSKPSYHLIFGQVTKSATHSLKLKYFAQFANFVKDADCVVSSIEIGFIVPTGKR